MSKLKVPPGFNDMMHFSLVDAILGRCSRRFFHGAEIPDGVFQYQSKLKPFPVSELEKLLIVTACGGNTVRHNLFAADAAVLQDKAFVENVHRLGQLGVMCDLVMPVEKMPLGIELVAHCSETTFVINHCGVCPIQADAATKTFWREGIMQYAKHTNAICKISESGFTRPDYEWQIEDVMEIIQHSVTSFGEDRIAQRRRPCRL